VELPMSEEDEESISRRQLFTGWARGLTEGISEWVLPEIERETERIRDAFSDVEYQVDAVHPWRDLLEPRPGDSESVSTD
jgi:hypothetical protein